MTSACIKTDLKDRRVPPCLYWSTQQVSEWLESLGLERYKDCFENNHVDGRMLIMVTAARLPDMGVTDFDHILTITSGIRELMELEAPDWTRSISIPPRNQIGMYIETKAVRGLRSDNMTFQQYMNTQQNVLWQPPLNNHCQLLPHN